MSSTRLFLGGLGLGAGLALLACSGSSTSSSDLGALQGSSSSGSPGSSGAEGGDPPPAPVPKEEIRVAPPSTQLEVTATIIAATLGDECAAASRFADCAPTPDGGSCGLTCQKSNVQLSFKTGAGEGGKTAKVEVVTVTLHDARSGAKLDTLVASAPRSWNGSTYAPWSETLTPSSDVKASYDLTAPAWSKIGSGDAWSTYSGQYKLQVTLSIDGVQVVLGSTVLSREPAVAT